MTEIQQHTMSREDAERLTERIRMVATTFMETRDKLARLVREAQEGGAHEALGFRSWTEYIAQVFSDTPLMRLTRDERRVIVSDLAEQGMSTRAIAPVVGASHMSVARDLGDSPVTPVTPASPATPAEPDVPTFDPTPSWDPVDTETGEITPEPRPVTGLDGKTYTRPDPKETPEPAKPRRRPITDQFFDAAYDFRKNVERLDKLTTDDRFPKNKEQIALSHKNDLLQLAETLQNVLRELD